MDPNVNSIEEMKQYARDELGHNFPDDVADESVRKVISEATGIALKRTARPKKASPKEPATPDKFDPKVGPGRRRIVIHKVGEAGGDKDVIVGVNGRMFQIKRGVEVDVPASVVEVLRNAVENRYEMREDPITKQAELIERQSQSYPYSDLGPA